MVHDDEDGSGEHDVPSWWERHVNWHVGRLRGWLVRLRQRLALRLWIADGRLPGGAVDPRMLAEGHSVGDEYDITVRYAEGAVVRLRGACSRDRTSRLTGFMSVFERPYYQILVVGGASLEIDTTKGPLVGQSIVTGVGVGVLDHSVVSIKGATEGGPDA